MKKSLFLFACLGFFSPAFGQKSTPTPAQTFTTKSGVCGTLQKEVEIPNTYSFSNVTPLKRLAPSSYKNKRYPTEKVLVGPTIIQNYEVVITWGLFFDPSGCETPYCDTIRIDTIPTYTQEVGSPKISNMWVIRTGIWITSEVSMPAGFIVSQLPKNHEKAGYWVTSYGEFWTKKEADNSLGIFLERYPEFKKADPYVYFLVSCPEQYKYVLSTQ